MSEDLRDNLRQQIATRLGWTPNEEKAEAWHEAVEAALDIAVPIAASRRDWAAEATCMDGCDRTPRDPAAMPTPGQLLHRLHTVAVDEQLALANRMIEANETAYRCVAHGHVERIARDDDLYIEVGLLRRELEFEANAVDPSEEGGYSRDNIRFPLCACLSDEQAEQLQAVNAARPDAPKWSLPLCAVHPEADDAALLAVAEARVAADTGERHSLDDVAREFGVDLTEPSVHPEADR